MRLLGIDIGTGGTRAVLLDGDGRVVGSATAAHPPFASPHAGWAEQDPDDWWSGRVQRGARVPGARQDGARVRSAGWA